MITEDDFYFGRDELQKLTDEYIKKIDEIGAAKEEEILEI
jgi:ribosome recycling factor